MSASQFLYHDIYDRFREGIDIYTWSLSSVFQIYLLRKAAETNLAESFYKTQISIYSSMLVRNMLVSVA
jgi:hypothetical protein